MADILGTIEEARRTARQSQEQVARALGVSQAHYSKVITAKVPLTDELRAQMESWLAARSVGAGGDEASRRMHELAASIRRECKELMDLVTQATRTSNPGASRERKPDQRGG